MDDQELLRRMDAISVRLLCLRPEQQRIFGMCCLWRGLAVCLDATRAGHQPDCQVIAMAIEGFFTGSPIGQYRENADVVRTMCIEELRDDGGDAGVTIFVYAAAVADFFDHLEHDPSRAQYAASLMFELLESLEVAADPPADADMDRLKARELQRQHDDLAELVHQQDPGYWKGRCAGYDLFDGWRIAYPLQPGNHPTGQSSPRDAPPQRRATGSLSPEAVSAAFRDHYLTEFGPPDQILPADGAHPLSASIHYQLGKDQWCITTLGLSRSVARDGFHYEVICVINADEVVVARCLLQALEKHLDALPGSAWGFAIDGCGGLAPYGKDGFYFFRADSMPTTFIHVGGRLDDRLRIIQAMPITQAEYRRLDRVGVRALERRLAEAEAEADPTDLWRKSSI